MNTNFHTHHFPNIFDIKIDTSPSNITIAQAQPQQYSKKSQRQQYSPQLTQHNDKRTQDQLMNNLEFSIEDLLSKIAKVREQNQDKSKNKSPQKQSQQPLSFKISNLSASTQSNSNRSRSDQHIQKPDFDLSGSRRLGSETKMETLTNSQKNVKIVLPQTQNIRHQRRNLQNNISHKQVRIEIKNLLNPFESSSFGKVQTNQDRNQKKSIIIQDHPYESESGYQQIPMDSLRKVNSLFDGKGIRQVAASKIFDSPQKNQNQPTLKMHNPFLTIVDSSDPIIQSRLRKMHQSYLETPTIKINGIEKREVIQKQPLLTIRDFQLGRQLGSGKFGDVYQAVHKKSGALYAIKKIFKSTILEYNMVEQFTRELKIHYSLNYPNIIQLYTHFDDEYHVFLVMEYGQGGMLMEKLKKGQKFTSIIVQQMLRSVDYLQYRKIAHRDIKPENIVMMFEDTAKLCDFGWSRVFDSDMKKTFCGTLQYVSPEMKDQGEYSLKIDIWSLGVLTFQLISGYGPFKNEITNWKKKGGNLNQAWNWNILYPPQISSVAQSFMRNLLKQNPNERASIRFCLNHLFIRKYNQMHYDQEQDKRYRQIANVLRENQ